MSLRYTDLHHTVENEIKRMAAVMPEPIRIDMSCPTIETVVNEVCLHLDISEERVFSKSRESNIVFARHLIHSICAALIRKGVGKWTLKDISSYTGKDHSTILHASRVISNMIATEYRYSTIDYVCGLFGLTTLDLKYHPKNTTRATKVKVYTKNNKLKGVFPSIKIASEKIEMTYTGVLMALDRLTPTKRGYIIKSY